MKRKRQVKNAESVKNSEHSGTTDTFRSRINGKLQTLFSSFLSELQSISEEKRPDLSVLFSTNYGVLNGSDNSSDTSLLLPGDEVSCTDKSTLILRNFIDTAKSRISVLLDKDQKVQDTGRVNLLENLQTSSKTKTVCIDPLQLQISLKLQSLLCKALDSKKRNEKPGSVPQESVITETDWQDLSTLLQDFINSAKRKLSASLAKDDKSGSTNRSVTRNPICNTAAISHNKELLTQSCGLSDSSLDQCSSQSKRKKETVPESTAMESSGDSGDGYDFEPRSSPPSDSQLNEGGGIMLLHEAERAPDYLELDIDSDSDDPIPPPQPSASKSDSDEDVIILGEKRPTYEEITLDEDDDGEVYESVVEKELKKPAETDNEIEELLFNCPKCDKSFRVESLLKFHLRMHGSETPLSNATEQPSPSSEEEDSILEKISNNNHSARKEPHSMKASSTFSHKKSRREKYKKRRSKEVASH